MWNIHLIGRHQMANQKYDTHLSIALCVYAIVYVIVLPMVFGVQKSYSSYYSNSPEWFMLLTSILALGLWKYTGDGWVVPAYALSAVALFNHLAYPITHFTAAIVFFVATTVIMIRDKRYAWYGRMSLMCYPLLLISNRGGLFWFEVIQIIILAAYHMRRVLHIMKLRNNK